MCARPRSRRQSYGNQAGGGTVHYGAVSWRMHEDDFRARSQTIERYGASAIPDGFLARRLAFELRRSRALLRPRRIRARRVGQGRQSARAGRSTAATCSKRRAVANIRCRRCCEDQSGVLPSTPAARKLGYHPFSTPRAILSQPYGGRPGCTYCGFCQAFGCHVGAKSSILVTKLPEADATGNFKLLTGAMCYRVNSDNSGRATGVSYYGARRLGQHDRSRDRDPTTFIYDNTRLLLLSKTDKFPNGLANSSGHVGKHVMAHMMANVFVGFDDRHINIYMGPERAEAHARRLQRGQFRSQRFGLHPRLADFDRHRQPAGRPDRADHARRRRPDVPRWGAAYRDFLANILHASRRRWWRRPRTCPMPTR